MSAAAIPAAPTTTQQCLLALYLLQDVARLAEQGHHLSTDWIKHHGLLVGIVGSNRGVAMRLIRRSSCLGCGGDLPAGSTGDHVIALACGGPAGAENYLPLCGPCNSSKGKRDLLDWWTVKGRPAAQLPPDALCAYARLAFAHHRRLGTLNEPAAAALIQTVDELAGNLLDTEQHWMMRQRISWVSGRRW